MKIKFYHRIGFIGYIYSITSLLTKQIYIGSSQNVELRWAWHRLNLELKRHTNSRLQNLYNLYGLSNLEFKQIGAVEVNTYDDLLRVEGRGIRNIPEQLRININCYPELTETHKDLHPRVSILIEKST